MLEIAIVNITMSLATSALSLLMAARAWRQRHIQGAVSFVGMVLAVAWVTWWYTFEAAANGNLDVYVSLSKLEYIGLVFIPLLWLSFAFNFSRWERRFSLTTRSLLALIPLITIILAFTNEYHGLIWAVPRFDPTFEAPVFAPVYGVWFWVYVVYSYTIFLFGSVILIRYALSTWKLYRNQALLILAGTAMPWISNFITIFHNLNPFPYLYLNAIFLGACVICFAFAVFRLRLLDIVPLAYDTILNNVPDGIIVVDLNDRIVAINNYVKPYLAHPAQAPIGQHITEALSHYAAIFEAFKGTVNHKIELEVEERIVEIRTSPAIDRQGKQRGRLFVISDITAKARADQAKRSEQQFLETMNTIGTSLNSSLDTTRVTSLILESLNQLIPNSRFNIMLINEDGHTMRLLQHRGYSPVEAALLETMTLDCRDFPLFQQAVQTRLPFVVADSREEPVWKHIEGLNNAVSFASMPILMDGDLQGFINIENEIPGTLKPEMVSRLKIFAQQASLAIKNARLYEETYEQAGELQRRVNSLMITQQVYKEISFSLNINLLLELVLDATLRVSGADAGYVALIQDNQLQLMQHYGEYDLAHLNAVLRNRSGIIGKCIDERRIVTVDNPPVYGTGLTNTESQIALPLFASNQAGEDTFYGVIVLETDNQNRFTRDRVQLLSLIADRVAVALYNTRLVNTVRERAAELEILYDKVSYLEKFKSDMIRIAAHDLKNPLHVIRNYLEMLVEPSDFEVDLNKAYPAMLRSSDRMLQIIQDFLSLDRIEQAAEQQTMEPFDLRGVVTSALGEFISRAMQKSQQLDYDLPDKPCIVVGDASQIREAVVNFVSNAIKYTPENGSIMVTLKEDAHTAQLEVRDNGYGIAKEEQSALFQPFYRAGSSQVAEVEGSGLGLHLTKNIIQRQGGKIIFRSAHQEGSTFGFQLPLYQPENTSAVAS